MASTPSYDPTALASHKADDQKNSWSKLNDADPSVLTNRAISQTYPPGSTFKLIDTAAALSSGQYTPDSQLTAARQITLQGTNTTLQNFNGNQCGTGTSASLRDALQRSCNTAFAELGAALGEKAIRDQAGLFGIGLPDQKIPLTVQPSTLGDIQDTAALEQSSIGQRDVALTPLQNAMVVAAIANGGQVMAPYLVKEIQGPELQTVETTDPDRIGTAIDSSVAKTLTDLMVNNEHSYSNSGKITGVEIAAKTGTAEHGSDPKATPPHVWYVAFAPAYDPQVAVAVLIENGGDASDLEATGGLVAAPVGRAVIRAALGAAP
jgi:peptidoglycan glycosyltransferase